MHTYTFSFILNNYHNSKNLHFHIYTSINMHGIKTNILQYFLNFQVCPEENISVLLWNQMWLLQCETKICFQTTFFYLVGIYIKELD